MGQFKYVSILMVVTAAAAMLHSTEAANYVVGGSTGWTDSPPGGASFYSDWASNITFRENDVLVFNFVTGSHTVAELTKTNYDDCNVRQSIQTLVTSPVRVTLNRTGEFYFSCTFQGHCSNGQKLSVDVAGSSPAPSQGPSPPGTTPSDGAPPPSSTTEPGATPPSPGSATTHFASCSLLLATFFVNVLFLSLTF